MILQALRISFLEIVSGGAMRIQFGANKNQSVNTPFFMQRSITFLFVSKLSNSMAINNPRERIAFMAG